MNWNPFKRIADLERDVRTQAAQIADTSRLLNTTVLKLNTLILRADDQENRLASLQNQFVNRPFPQPVTTITRADVEKEAKRRLQRAAYARKYYANKRAEKAKAAAAAGEAK